jgi:hypothetical protein
LATIVDSTTASNGVEKIFSFKDITSFTNATVAISNMTLGLEATSAFLRLGRRSTSIPARRDWR